MDVVRAVAETVGTGLRGLGEPNDEDDPAHNGYKADEEITAGFANVVQAAPCHGQVGKQHCSAENAADPGLKRQDAGEQENKQSPPPEFGTSGPAVEVHVLADAGLDGTDEIAGGTVLRGLLPGTLGSTLRLLPLSLRTTLWLLPLSLRTTLWLLPLSLRTTLWLLPLIVVIRIQNMKLFINYSYYKRNILQGRCGQPLIPLIFINAYCDTIIAKKYSAIQNLCDGAFLGVGIRVFTLSFCMTRRL